MSKRDSSENNKSTNSSGVKKVKFSGCQFFYFEKNDCLDQSTNSPKNNLPSSPMKRKHKKVLINDSEKEVYENKPLESSYNFNFEAKKMENKIKIEKLE